MKRKEFLKTTAFAAGGSVFLPSFSSLTSNPSKFMGANDRLRVGAIGINGMGWSDTKSLLKIPGVELVALCDVDQNAIQRRLKELGNKAKNVKVFADYRELLDQKEVDIVVIGTPDHWHALMLVHAAEAGKHIYVEKPIGNSIGECRTMVAAQEKYNSIVQVGQWQRSQQHFRNAVSYIQSGVLGNIRTVKVWCYQGWMSPQAVVPNSAPPKGVDFKNWLGPAKSVPFNSSRFHFHFRWFWDYAGGLMTDWGVHLLDYALLGMNTDVPKSIVGLGGHFAYPDKSQETPDTLTTLYEFDTFNLVWDSAMGIDNGSYGRDHGIAFIGNNATLILNRGGWEVIEEKKSKNKVAKALEKPLDKGLDMHTKNFVDAIRKNDPSAVNCTIQQGAHVATVAQMGNISYRTQQKLIWDKEQEKFTDEKVNQTYLSSTYHNGYSLPKI